MLFFNRYSTINSCFRATLTSLNLFSVASTILLGIKTLLHESSNTSLILLYDSYLLSSAFLVSIRLFNTDLELIISLLSLDSSSTFDKSLSLFISSVKPESVLSLFISDISQVLPSDCSDSFNSYFITYLTPTQLNADVSKMDDIYNKLKILNTFLFLNI
ncbi:hypothetical protein [Mycoplasma bradburyae]|uniref:hypothetical protein n=1 Tax=Mycoplasma bradburyae TaxID=2963128 RepID=UPI002341E0BB|nr:hypothetical protein [Mycoplasma bradburyae]MDC4182470.1 hypothetical protein [Mycoplasma bradburyae]